MKFKIDENLPLEAAECLAEAGYDASSIVAQRMSGTPDPQVAAVCRREDRVLVTLDMDFADIRTYSPGDSPGIIILRPVTQSKTSILALLERVIGLFSTEHLSGRLWLVDEKRVRIRGE